MSEPKTLTDYLKAIEGIRGPIEANEDADMRKGQAWLLRLDAIFPEGLESPIMQMHQAMNAVAGAPDPKDAFLKAVAPAGGVLEPFNAATAAVDAIMASPQSVAYEKAVKVALRAIKIITSRIVSGKAGVHELEGIATGAYEASMRSEDEGLAALANSIEVMAKTAYDYIYPRNEKLRDMHKAVLLELADAGMRQYLKEDPEAAKILRVLDAGRYLTAAELSAATGLAVTDAKMGAIEKNVGDLYRGTPFDSPSPVSGIFGEPMAYGTFGDERFSRLIQQSTPPATAPKPPAP